MIDGASWLRPVVNKFVNESMFVSFASLRERGRERECVCVCV